MNDNNFYNYNLNLAINSLEPFCTHQENGLPEDIFLMFSRHIPIVNVDLFIIDEKNRILLSWRDDEFCGKGWHIPGGVIKVKETIDECIRRVSLRELGCEVAFDTSPTVVQHIEEQETRGHFISLIFFCMLPEKYTLISKQYNEVGYLEWHKKCPKNIINVHKKYIKLINKVTKNNNKKRLPIITKDKYKKWVNQW